MTTALIWDERFAWHDAGRASSNRWAEPYEALDRPECKRRIWSLVQASGLGAQLGHVAARPATQAELLRFHTTDYLARLEQMSASGGGDAGESARFGPNGFEIAALAVGGCLEAVDAVLTGRADNAYVLARPCGHHAEPDRGRGFCLFGNVALAALHAKEAHGIKRIAVIDWDVHHGNGTQLAFYDEPSVLTVSLHQERCYPSQGGDAEERGEGAGRGFNLNLPLPAGSGHGAYVAAFERQVLPTVEAFRPEMIFVACGLDAAASDPLGRMMCHSETFRQLTLKTRKAAESLCGGRLVMCHEGGYSPTYAPFCGLATLEALSGRRTDIDDPLLGWYARLGGQELQPHQAAAIESAASVAAPAV